MSGEVTGSKQTNITCIPKTTNTVTEATWKERVADGGWFVKFDAATSTADEYGCTFLANNDATCLGRLIGYTGSGDKFRVSIETEGLRGLAQGGDEGAFATADITDRLKANSNGKLVSDDSLTVGNMFVVGGTKEQPAVFWRGQVK